MLNVSQRALDLNDKGERLAGEGKLDEALAAFSGAVLASPGYARAWLNRADVLERLGRVAEAEADRGAARSLTASGMRPFQPPPQAAAYQWTAPAPPRARLEYERDDVVGPGRYILNFFLAGFVGLLLTFILRNHGWLATWICLGILVVSVAMLAATGPEAWGPPFESSSN